MAREIRIGFDIDSVALMYTERFCEVFPMFGGKTDLSNPTEFNFLNQIQESEKKALYMTFAYMMQETLPMYEDFKELLGFVLTRYGKAQFITARNEKLSKNGAMQSIEVAMSDWMSYCQIHRDIKIDCVGKGGIHGSKVPLIKKHNMGFFVEDRRKNVLEISHAGVTVFMPRRSWNTLPEDTPNVIQYDDCQEIIKYLRNLK